ncbi:hypothetical protein CHMI_03719 [Cellulomonas hominis]|nr:hypothetical protein CHMI_03719 [Cellulomonas hominis]
MARMSDHWTALLACVEDDDHVEASVARALEAATASGTPVDAALLGLDATPGPAPRSNEEWRAAVVDLVNAHAGALQQLLPLDDDGETAATAPYEAEEAFLHALAAGYSDRPAD